MVKFEKKEKKKNIVKGRVVREISKGFGKCKID